MRWALDRSPLPAFILSYKTKTLSKRGIIYHRGFPRFCSIMLAMEMKANKLGQLSFNERMMSLKRDHQMSMTSVQSYVSVKLQDDISDIGVTLCVREPSSLYQWHWCNLTCKWNLVTLVQLYVSVNLQGYSNGAVAILRVREPRGYFDCTGIVLRASESVLNMF